MTPAPSEPEEVDLADIDRHFGAFIARFGGNQSTVQPVAALLSRAVRQGHVCLDLNQEEFAKTGKSDDLRPLTSAGMEEMKEIARGLRELVKKIDLVVPSPLVRAVQTAEIVAAAYDIPVSEPTTALSPDSEPQDFEKWSADFEDAKRIAVVGHEPHLTALVSWLLTGEDDFRCLEFVT